MFVELEERQMTFEECLRNHDHEFHMQTVQLLVGCHPYVGPSNHSHYDEYQHYNPPPYYESSKHI